MGSSQGSTSEVRRLRQFARACGVQDIYIDGTGQRRVADAEALLAVLRSLGTPISRVAEAQEHEERLSQERAGRLCPPIVIVWLDEARTVPLNLREEGKVELTVEEESGRTRSWSIRPDDDDVDHGEEGTVWRGLPEDLAPGVHRLVVRQAGAEERAALLAAPGRCFRPERSSHPELGVFLPLYAAHSEDDWGLGDLSELDALVEWAGGCGCALFGTLPLLACFLDKPFDPSPYSPISRRLFGEVFLDMNRLAEGAPPEALPLLSSSGVQEDLRLARKSETVDYARVWGLKRRVLGAMARAAFSREQERTAIEEFAQRAPLVADYARFRGAMARHGTTWRHWPAEARDGRLGAEDVDEEEERLFLYAQWRLSAQLEDLRELERRSGCSLYLDLPIGVHGDGFDTWRHQGLFATGVSLGAPPDAFFAHGQCWGFPPVSPEASRADGHAYFADSVDRHLSIGSALRIDHVAGLHRCFWVPDGMSADEGVYVRQPAEEYYALLSILSHRRRAVIVGENLGTVPREVNRALRRRGVLGMSIAQFELGDEDQPLPKPPEDTLCALNTHDMPTFAAFWSGRDIDLHVELGLFDAASAAEQREERATMAERVAEALELTGAEAADAGVVMRALLERLVRTDAKILLLNLEDLWQEERPQNVPGTAYHLIWRGHAARSVESIVADGPLEALIRSLAQPVRQAL